MKNLAKKLFLLLTAFSFITRCFGPVYAEEAESIFSLKDLSVRDLSEAQEILLEGESITITEGGIYALSGTIEDGSVTVDLEEEDTVYLLLNGVSITNTSGSALHIGGTDKVILTLVEGTVNTLSQGENDPEASKNKAAIYSSDSLTINGTGTLIVNGRYQDGINCRDKLRIVSGNIAVTAKEDGLIGKDAVCIGGGNLTVIAENGDGIKSTNSDDSTLGFITICGGIISVITGDGAASVEHTAEMPFGMWSAFGAENTDDSESISQKGIKAKSSVTISAGSITIDSVDDAIHSDGDIAITGGILTLSSGDDGIHADNTLTVSDGTIDILLSYEGLEAADLHLDGGTISVIASDDGINAAGGDSGETVEATTELPGGWGARGFGGMDMFSESTGTLTITGGTISVQAGGDGIDVNGDFLMTGGTVTVIGPEDSFNSALDYDGTFTMTGGTLLAVGQSGMAQGVSAPSVPGAMVTISSGELTVSDASGNLLFSCDATGNYDTAVIYSEIFTENEDYLITSGENSQTVTMTTDPTPGFSMGGMGMGMGRGGHGQGFGRQMPEFQSGEIPELPEGMENGFPEGPGGMEFPGFPDGTPPESAAQE